MNQPYLFALALTSTIVLLTAFILHAVMRRSSAASRRAMWIGTFVALAVGVLAGFIPAEVRVSVPAPRVEIQPLLDPAVPPGPVARPSDSLVPEVVAEVPAAAPTYPSLVSILTALWLVGIVMMVVRWMASQRRVRVLLKTAAPVALPEFPNAAVRESEETVVPFLAGILSAVIVLPARWRSWPAEQIRAAVFHELGHAAVRDHWFQPLVELVCAVHWFNPLVWWARRRLYLVREMAADDHALLQGLRPSKYARVLVDVSAHCARSSAHPVLSMARPTGVSERVVGILDGTRLRTRSRGWLLATTCILLATAVGLGCFEIVERKVVHGQLPTRDKILARIADHQPAQPSQIVVGVVAGDQQMIVTTGGATEETVFGVGSISELFIELAFADMVVRGEVDPHSVVHDDITFLDLASHNSGLPALPDNFAEGRYSKADLDEFLASYRPSSSGEFVYSYLGVGLQGDRLAAAVGTNYRDLVRTRVLEPLELDHTDYMGRDAALRPLMATGHAPDGAPLEPRTDAPLLGACCAARTSAADLLEVARLFVDARTSRFARAVDFMRVPRTPTRRHDEMVGVGFSHGPNGLLFKRGGGRGFRSYVAIVPSSGVAVVVLANHASVMTEVLGAEVLREVELRNRGPGTAVRSTTLPKDLVSVHASFDKKIEFIGARVDPAEVAPGDDVEVSFYYRALGDIDRDWKIFVHGDGGSGAPRLHADHYPAWSTTKWPVGAIVQDTFTMTVPPDYPQAHFTVWTGFYQGRGRMSVTNDARTDGVNRVRGPTVRVREME